VKRIDHNAIQRSVGAMAYQIQDDVYRKRHAADDYKLAETMQQVQIKVSGTSGSGAWTTETVNFSEIIYYSPRQRLNRNEDPQVWWGAVLDNGRAFFSVHVEKWLLDTNANFTGAVIAIGAQGDGSQYSGTIHVTFQGRSAPTDTPCMYDGPS
jgi:hypothetical protein